MTGLGVWIPAGKDVRVLLKLNLGFGAFQPPSGTPDAGSMGSQGHTVGLLTLEGLFNAGL